MGLLSNPGFSADIDRQEAPNGSVRGRGARQTQTRLTAKQVSDLAEQYRSGSTVAALVATYGVCRGTVLAHLERRSVPRRPTKRALTDEHAQRAAELYISGLSLAEVGKEFGVDATTIRRELVNLGVPRRPQGWSGRQAAS